MMYFAHLIEFFACISYDLNKWTVCCFVIFSFPNRHPVNDFDTYFPADKIYWNTSMSSNLTSSLPDKPHIQGPYRALPFPWPPLYLFPLLTCRFSHCPYTWLARWLGITGISDILTSSTNSPSLSLVLKPGFWILSISCYPLRPMCLPDLFLFTSCLFGHAQHLKLSSKYNFFFIYIYKEKKI